MLLDSLLPISIFFALLIIICVYTKKKRPSEKYDEMQLIIRGNAYKLALFVVLILNALAGLCYALVDFDLSQYIDYPMASFCILYVGITIFAIYAILHDAFFSVNDNGKTYIYVCILVIVVNLAALIPTIINGEFMPNGSLQFSQGGGNFLNAFCFVFILIAILVKKGLNKKEASE